MRPLRGVVHVVQGTGGLLTHLCCSHLGAGAGEAAQQDAVQKQVEAATGNAVSTSEANRAEAERVLGAVKDQIGGA